MRAMVTLVVLGAVLFCNGCIMVGATVAAIGAIVTVKMKPSSRVAATAPGPAGGLSQESAAGLAKAGQVVIVDAGTGAKAELPWQEGMRLAGAAMAGNFNGNFRAARIFRGGRLLAADLQGAQNGGAELLLRAGDVVELHR